MLPIPLIAGGILLCVLVNVRRRASLNGTRWHRWAAWLFGVSLLFAFPFSLITLPYLLLKQEVWRGWGLAPWITSLWRGFGWLGATGWLLAPWLIKRCGGIRFVSPTETRVMSRGMMVLVLVFSVPDAGLLMLAGLSARARPITTATSPDSRLRATAYVIPGFLDASHSIVLQRNTRYPLVAREIYGVDSSKAGPPALSWTPDSSIVALWFGKVPVFAYDVRTKRKLWLAMDAYRIALPEGLRATHGSDTLTVLSEAGFDGGRFLTHAALDGNVKTVTALLDRGINVNAKPDGSTALQGAALYGHVEVVRELLARGADPNLMSYDWGATPLGTASARGHTDVVGELLAYNADPNLRSQGGSSALMSAAYNGHRAIVELLLAHHADPSLTNDKGASALTWATEQGHEDIAQLLRAQLPAPAR